MLLTYFSNIEEDVERYLFLYVTIDASLSKRVSFTKLVQLHLLTLTVTSLHYDH